GGSAAGGSGAFGSMAGAGLGGAVSGGCGEGTTAICESEAAGPSLRGKTCAPSGFARQPTCQATAPPARSTQTATAEPIITGEMRGDFFGGCGTARSILSSGRGVRAPDNSCSTLSTSRLPSALCSTHCLLAS